MCHAANWSSLLEDRLVESAQGLEAAVGGVTSRFRASLVTKNAREAQVRLAGLHLISQGDLMLWVSSVQSSSMSLVV